MKDKIYDYIIAGAGLTGLNLNKELMSFKSDLKTIILEKSKACGGRMATRRIDDSKFDHGAQFIKRTDISEALLVFLQDKEVLKKFPSENMLAFYGPQGMTQPAKKLAEKLDIQYNFKASVLKKNFSDFWEIQAEDGTVLNAKNIVLTFPLPQSLELLDRSQISYHPELSEITYSKAIVLLVDLHSDLSTPILYTENFDSEIFSVCSQAAKGLSLQPAYTIVMSPTWSESKFNLSDEEITANLKTVFKNKFRSDDIKNIQIKKWRYSQPTQIYENFFYSPAPGLYLAGDAFGGPSLNGALRSSSALFNFLKNSFCHYQAL